MASVFEDKKSYKNYLIKGRKEAIETMKECLYKDEFPRTERGCRWGSVLTGGEPSFKEEKIPLLDFVGGNAGLPYEIVTMAYGSALGYPPAPHLQDMAKNISDKLRKVGQSILDSSPMKEVNRVLNFIGNYDNFAKVDWTLLTELWSNSILAEYKNDEEEIKNLIDPGPKFLPPDDPLDNSYWHEPPYNLLFYGINQNIAFKRWINERWLDEEEAKWEELKPILQEVKVFWEKYIEHIV